MPNTPKKPNSFDLSQLAPEQCLDLSPEASPTLSEMTAAYDHPPIGPIGRAPTGRVLSTEGDADRAARAARAKAPEGRKVPGL
jgi:hypothetical protein